MTEYLMCKALAKADGGIEYEAPKVVNLELDDIIKEDKRYGKMTPANGGDRFTYKVYNEDEEIKLKQVEKSVMLGFRRWALRTPLKMGKARNNQKVDFKIEFRTVDSDPDKQLTSNTLMYHYFPINNFDYRLRGLCVVNKAFRWTTHGRSIPMYEIDPDTNFPTSTVKTYDFDQVYAHEIGHGLGLPHAPNEGHIMSPYYTIMREYLSDLDIKRMQAKYGVREISENRLKRWLNWLFHASER